MKLKRLLLFINKCIIWHYSHLVCNFCPTMKSCLARATETLWVMARPWIIAYSERKKCFLYEYFRQYSNIQKQKNRSFHICFKSVGAVVCNTSSGNRISVKNSTSLSMKCISFSAHDVPQMTEKDVLVFLSVQVDRHVQALLFKISCLPIACILLTMLWKLH